MTTRPSTIGSSVRTVAIAGVLAASVTAVVAAWAIEPVQASRPQITANPVDPTIVATLPPFVTLVTVAPATFVTAPPVSETTTTMAETTTTTSDTTTTTTDATATTEPLTTNGTGTAADQPSQPTTEAEYSLAIDLAQVDCDGTIHVEYSTTASPAPATLANHIVMYNPTSSPTAFTVVETSDNAANGSFAFDGPGAPDLTYRIFVVGLFDPTDPDGPKVVDQADVAVVAGC